MSPPAAPDTHSTREGRGMTMTLRIAILCAVLAASGSPRSALTAEAPEAKREIEKLGMFLGRWDTTGEMKDTPFSKARTKSHDEMTCDWTPRHGFLVCDQMIHTPAGTRNDLSIYTYNEKERSFGFFGISRDDAEARTTKLTIQGNVWTYWDEADEAGKHIQFRTTNTFQSPATVVWRSEYSEDGAHWILMGEGTDTRKK
jgi:hypothetical protein